ncbi:hypothetical protein U9D55_000436 [Enterobacter roggenkampii]|nr:hypothetical protein [Enterobacter roggenkampii]
MSKFAELDEMILRVLDTETPTPFMAIHFADGIHEGIHAECEKLAPGNKYGFRVLDRRLQVLRKAGRIKNISASKGWVKL